MLGAALICVVLLVVTSALGVSDGGLLIVRAYAQSKQQNPLEKARTAAETLINRLRSQDMPEGIVKTNGRIEATQVDVAAKYPGRLATLTVFLSTHFMNEAERCDRISLMYRGRVLAVAAPNELIKERGKEPPRVMLVLALAAHRLDGIQPCQGGDCRGTPLRRTGAADAQALCLGYDHMERVSSRGQVPGMGNPRGQGVQSERESAGSSWSAAKGPAFKNGPLTQIHPCARAAVQT